MDFHLRLIIAGGGEYLATARGNRRVALDLRCSNAAQSFNRKSERRHIEEENILHLTGEHTGLDRCTNGNHLIRIDALVRFLSEEGPDSVLHGWHTGHATHHDYFIDVAGGQTGIG